MPTLTTILREIETDADLFARKQKISSVAGYLQTKQVKQTIDQKPKTEENINQVSDSFAATVTIKLEPLVAGNGVL